MFWPFGKKKEKSAVFESKRGTGELDTLKANRLADAAYEMTAAVAAETGERKAGSEATRKCARLLQYLVRCRNLPDVMHRCGIFYMVDVILR